ncbi:hypothetical protein ACHAW6_009098 [Cyclotella cf. meneghiniana]
MLGIAPSGVVNSGVTSPCGSNRLFQVPKGQVVPASKRTKLLHDVWKTGRTVDLVLSMKQHSLISAGKFEFAEYLIIFDNKEVNIYNGLNAEINISEETIIMGWQDPDTGLHRMLLSKIREFEYGYSMLDKEHSEKIQITIQKAVNSVNNIYVEKAIRHLHVAGDLPPKATWLKAI